MLNRTDDAFDASVLITSKDRRDTLRRAVESVCRQDAKLELVVVDDGSSDGTAEMVRTEFPQVRLVRNERPLGIIAARNRAAELVRSNILLTLDDDAVYTSADTVSGVLRHFDDPQVGAVAIPHINFLRGRRQSVNLVDWAARPDFPCVAAYAGGASAKRVDLFRSLGGYDGIGRQGEERSYCLKMLVRGYVVRIADCAPIHHFPETGRDDRHLIVEAGARNSVIFAWRHAPSSRLALHVGGIFLNQGRAGLRERQLRAAISGLLGGLAAIGKVERRPAPHEAYRLQRRLLKAGPLPVSEIRADAERLRQRCARQFEPAASTESSPGGRSRRRRPTQ